LLLAGITTGLTLGVFLLGQLVRRASERDAIVGICLGAAVVFCVLFGLPWVQSFWLRIEPERQFRIPDLLNPVIFSLTVLGSGWLSSLLLTRDVQGAKVP
jgi:hypothetical protein